MVAYKWHYSMWLELVHYITFCVDPFYLWKCNLYYSICVYGGGDRRHQIDNITSGVEIVIGELCMFFFFFLQCCVYIQESIADV